MAAATTTAFEFPIRIYWEDTDAGGIVYNANYLKFFERARTEWLRSLGINQGALRAARGGIFVVSSASLRFLRPARLDDELIATAALEKAGSAMLQISQQVLRRQGADLQARQVCCEGSVRVAWVSASSFKPARIPVDIVQRLSP
ncbi:MAG: YbgC/FadM family acyl-CoA thioesterase [Burkholderiaceae bacterium]|nr:YbgC/FadM family acyl-CoA thioesterase [Burkholderiaceae bacterium]